MRATCCRSLVLGLLNLVLGLLNLVLGLLKVGESDIAEEFIQSRHRLEPV
jgi:hypothetical protein